MYGAQKSIAKAKNAPTALGLDLAAQSLEQLGGGDDLAGVALGVVGDVDHDTAEGGGKAFAADPARRFEAGRVEGLQTPGGAGGGGAEGFKEHFGRNTLACLFFSERGELDFRET